jgi:hypothetical protein
MTRFQFIKEEFSGICGRINLSVGDIELTNINVDTDMISGWDMRFAEGSYYHTSEWFEENLSMWMDGINMFDYDSLILELVNLKNNP